MRKNKQSARSLTAFIVTWSFLVLTITGLVLYIVPHGRVAYWVHWSLAGMEKEQWGGVHMMFGGIFIVTGILHLYFNWKPFKKYLADRVKGHLMLKQEIVTASIFTLILFVLSVFNLPPASWVFDLNAKIKDSWVTSPELEPPFGHAEEVSLAAISRRMQLDLELALSELEKKGIRFAGKQDSLESIARKNHTTPMAIYALIRKHEKKQKVDLASMSPEDIEATYAGTGLGRKTLTELSKEIGFDLDEALRKLKQHGIVADRDQKLKSIADGHDVTPMELLKMIGRQETD